jgi:hypothetical protein
VSAKRKRVLQRRSVCEDLPDETPQPSPIRHVARSRAIGNVNRKIAPCGTFGDAHSLPP